MNRINLLAELQNYRNSVKPDGEKLTRPAYAMAFVMAVVSIAYWVFPPQWGDKPTKLMERMKQGVEVSQEKDDPGSFIDTEEVEEATPKITENADSLDVQSRPVASAIAPETPSESVTSQTPVAGREPVWRIRLGFCVLRESCESLVRDLRKKNIEAFLVDGVARMPANRVSFGPWPTETQALEARKKLKQNAIDTSLFSAGSKRYLVTAQLKSKADIDTILKKARVLNVKAGVSSKKESRKVTKAYLNEGFQERDSVMRKVGELKKMDIDCVAEKVG